MALKNYFQTGSYSRVENIVFDKELKIFNFIVSVYTDESASEKIFQKPFRTTGYALCREVAAFEESSEDDAFVFCGGVYYQRIPGSQLSDTAAAFVESDGRMTDHYFDTHFSIEHQQKYTDILAFTYNYLLTLPEFSGAESC